MENLLAVILGAGIAFIAGLMYRVVDARQHRRQWIRDHLRESASQFLADARIYLGVAIDRMVGDLPDDSRAIVGPATALDVDISRLQLVAPSAVSVEADEVLTRLRAAHVAAQAISAERFTETQGEALNAARAARAEIARFADLVRTYLA